MPDLLSVADARMAVVAEVDAPLGSEAVPLAGAAGRVLAADTVSPDSVPAADNSAMDGYALRAADTAGAPVELALRGESRAGGPSETELQPGEAFRISTGGVVPAGADSVVRVEDTEALGDDLVRIDVAVDPGNDIRRAGEDIRAGDTVLRAGRVLGAAELGVLSSIGASAPECTRRPTVAVVCTGDELLAPDEPMRPGGVRNSNAETLPELARLAGAEVISNERCRDDAGATVAAVEKALEADVAVFCGGVSVGVHDHVKDAFRDAGVEQGFWGVALRPGKPTWFGVQGGGPGNGGTLAFGLPGNPVSAFVTFILFVRPALRALSGAPTEPDRTRAELTADVPRMASRDQAVRCSLELSERGWLANPTGPQGSHILTSMIGADALAVIRAGDGAAEAGSRVEVELLRVASAV